MNRTETRIDYVRRRLGELGVPDSHIQWSKRAVGELEVLDGAELRRIRVSPMATRAAVDAELDRLEVFIRRARA